MNHALKLSLLAIFLLVAVFGGGLLYIHRDDFSAYRRNSDAVTAQMNRMRSEAKDRENAIRKADGIQDGRQRCLAYPDLPLIHWNALLIAEVCRERFLSTVTLEEIEIFLRDGNAEAVDRLFESYFAENTSDLSKKGILFFAYHQNFDTDNPRAGDAADKWVAQSPHSAYAHAARGVFNAYVGYEARGAALVQNTPDKSFDEMHRHFEIAKDELKQALQINSRLTAAAIYLLSVARADGDERETESIAQQAISADPTDEKIYIFWMNAAEPRWGGSLEKVDSIVRAANPYEDRFPLMRLVEARARFITVSADDHALGKDDYDEVLAIAPDLRALAEAAENLRGAQGIEYSSQLLRFDPSIEHYFFRLRNLAGDPTWTKRDMDRNIELAQSASAKVRDVAKVLSVSGKMDESVRVYKDILKRNPRDTNALIELATLELLFYRDKKEAGLLIDQLMTISPRDPATWAQVALLNADSDTEKYCAAVAEYQRLGGKPGYNVEGRRHCSVAAPQQVQPSN